MLYPVVTRYYPLLPVVTRYLLDIICYPNFNGRLGAIHISDVRPCFYSYKIISQIFIVIVKILLNIRYDLLSSGSCASFAIISQAVSYVQTSLEGETSTTPVVFSLLLKYLSNIYCFSEHNVTYKT